MLGNAGSPRLAGHAGSRNVLVAWRQKANRGNGPDACSFSTITAGVTRPLSWGALRLTRVPSLAELQGQK